MIGDTQVTTIRGYDLCLLDLDPFYSWSKKAEIIWIRNLWAYLMKGITEEEKLEDAKVVSRNETYSLNLHVCMSG
jgi:hypothetical protein